MVDAVFRPVFRCFDEYGTRKHFGVFDKTPKVEAWRLQLARRPSVRDAVQSDDAERLMAFLLGGGLRCRVS